MAADLDRQLRFPVEITATSLRSDIVLWFTPVKTVIMVELTVPWEKGLEAAFERKKERSTELAAACSQVGWRVLTILVEIGRRSYIRASTQRLLKPPAANKRGHSEIWQRRQKVGVSGFGSTEGTEHGVNRDPRTSCGGQQEDVPAAAPPP